MESNVQITFYYLIIDSINNSVNIDLEILTD